jgi:outer membrane protein OmpA-like peptidoglycan-associated protein
MDRARSDTCHRARLGGVFCRLRRFVGQVSSRQLRRRGQRQHGHLLWRQSWDGTARSARAFRAGRRGQILLVLVALIIAGCTTYIPNTVGNSGPPKGTRTLLLPATRASVLVIITNPDSASAMRATGALIAASARPAQRVLILSAQGGLTVASSQAPDAPNIQVAGPPAPLPPHPTSFQQARYRQAVQQYQDMTIHARAALYRQQQHDLASWARTVIAAAYARPVPQRAQAFDIGTDLGVAASDLSSMRQAGLGYGAGTVIAIIGITQAAAWVMPASVSDLQSTTVVVDDYPGSIDEQAAWQAALLQGGAARAVVLTPAAHDQLIPVVRQGLDGAVIDTLTSVLFGLSQYKLRAVALPQLRQLLYLLTIKYPQAAVSIAGYTDSLPRPGGNLQLSRLRALEVAQWVIAHGVAAGRVQAFGYGDSDPVAPNSPAGQPLNRRVVVVIDPGVSA